MTDISITDKSIPSLAGKYAIVTGGASGIGLACCQLLAAHEAAGVLLLDLNPPSVQLPEVVQFRKCDVSNWDEIRAAFAAFEHVDYVFANAGQGKGGNPFAADANPDEAPGKGIVATNYQGALNTAVLGIRAMRKHGRGGSIVFTSSVTALSSERDLPVYASLKLALLGLVRSWRHQLIKENITVNAVTPGATPTNLLPALVTESLAAKGMLISTPEHVARALVFSAVGRESRRVEAYAYEKEEENEREGRWNGRVILPLGDRYTEVEEDLQRLKGEWYGEQNLKDTRHGQRIIASLTEGKTQTQE